MKRAVKSYCKEENLSEGKSLEFDFKLEQVEMIPQGQAGWTVTSPKPEPVWLLQSVIISTSSDVYYMFVNVGKQSFS